MATYQLSAFADEASPFIPEQIVAMRRNGVKWLEIRGVNHRNIADLPLSEARVVKSQLSSGGIKVFAIGSPAGKSQIRDNFDAELDRFRHLVDLGVELDAKCIRLFSFYGTDGDPAYRDEVLARLERFVDAAKGSGLILCHENEKGIYGDTAARCLEIHQALPGIRAVFDPANFVQCGEDTLKAWALLKDYVYYGHIKDALPDGRVVPPGDGNGKIAEYLPEFFAMGKRVLTLEPHLTHFVGLGALEQDEKVDHVGGISFPSAGAAFDYAADRLKQILASCQIQ